jgi:hypothetical protein
MARQGGQVQLEQSDISLALNMAKMAKGGLSRTAIEETETTNQEITHRSLRREEVGC